VAIDVAVGQRRFRRRAAGTVGHGGVPFCCKELARHVYRSGSIRVPGPPTAASSGAPEDAFVVHSAEAGIGGAP
jgi:hypothetical protein